jgi:hypothetical protein
MNWFWVWGGIYSSFWGEWIVHEFVVSNVACFLIGEWNGEEWGCCLLVSCEALGVDDSAVATEIPLLIWMHVRNLCLFKWVSEICPRSWVWENWESWIMMLFWAWKRRESGGACFRFSEVKTMNERSLVACY